MPVYRLMKWPFCWWLMIGKLLLQVIAFLRKKDEFISLVLKHIDTSAMMDLLLRLISCVEPTPLRQDVLNVSPEPVACQCSSVRSTQASRWCFIAASNHLRWPECRTGGFRQLAVATVCRYPSVSVPLNKHYVFCF